MNAIIVSLVDDALLKEVFKFLGLLVTRLLEVYAVTNVLDVAERPVGLHDGLAIGRHRDCWFRRRA